MKQRARRVVITGLGVVASNGIGQEAFWHATSHSISGIKPLQRFPVSDLPIQVGGEISDFVAQDYLERKLILRTDRVTHFALVAAQEAIRDARLVLEQEEPQRLGAVIANTLGGIEFGGVQMRALYERGPRAISVFTAIAWLQVAVTGQVSIRNGIQGYSKTPVNDTVGGLNALGMAYRAIGRGAADVIIAGGSEAFLHPFVLIELARSGQSVLGNDIAAYRPFDRRATGLIVAEGAGICILEDYEHAIRRDAPIYGEIVGYGQTNDGNGLVVTSSNGIQYARAIQLAMQEREIEQSDIAYFSGNGKAIPAADQSEVNALERVFGSDLAKLAVSVPRTMTGHSYAAAGALDTITALLALRYNLIPPTINIEELDPSYGLNLVQKEARPLTGSTVLLGGSNVSGANVVMAIQKLSS